MRRQTIQPINYEPDTRFEERVPKKGSKTDIVIRLLSRKDGVTLETLAKALSKTGTEVTPAYARAWVARSFLQPLGYGVRSDTSGKKLRLLIVRRAEAVEAA